MENTWLNERAIHLTVMDWVNNHPEIRPYVIHIPNESVRTPKYGALLKKMGMRKGASDLFIAMPRHKFHGAWIELKTVKGKPTSMQKKFLADMKKQGYYTNITYGLDEAIKIMDWYCFS